MANKNCAVAVFVLFGGCGTTPAGTPDAARRDDAGETRRDAAGEAPRDDAGETPRDDAGETPRDDAGGAGDAGVDASDAGNDAGYVERHDGGPRPSSDCREWRGPNPIRTLFVGNSQTYYFDMPGTLHVIAASAAPECPRIEVDEVTRGGASLQNLWEDALPDGTHLSDKLASGSFDAVIIQESIDLYELRPSPFPEQFFASARRIVEAARAHGVTPVLYATPYIEVASALPAHPGFAEMAAPQLELARVEGLALARGGLAWLRFWTEMPSIDLYASDRNHPNQRGSYISACTIYSALTGASPIGLTNDVAFPPSDPTITPCVQPDHSDCPVVTPAEATIFQRVAWTEHQQTLVELAAP